MSNDLSFLSLPALVDELHEAAAHASNGRASRTLSGGADRALRQTLIALASGQQLAEHESPGEATLQVLSGSVTFHAGQESVTLTAGDLLEIPPRRHALSAPEDVAFLLTVATHRA